MTFRAEPPWLAPMSYDPFARGKFPVGVRTANACDVSRDHRGLTFEIWYPATDAHAGQDLAEATRDAYELMPGFPAAWQAAVRDAAARPGSYPLVAFSHGFGSHRRQSTFLCTHLASHGYVVAAVDHTGNTIFDMIQWMMAVQMGGEQPDPVGTVRELITGRPLDVIFMIDELLRGAVDGVDTLIDRDRIGVSGHSFGGWTTLMVAGRDRRIRAVLPLAPAGGASPMPVEPLTGALNFNWGRDVPTLYLVAERDTLLPLPGMRELFDRTQSRKQMAVLKNADHMHFCDEVEQLHEMFRVMPPPGEFGRIAKFVPPITELCPGEHAYAFGKALGLAHLDAHLKGHTAAAAFLSDDVGAVFAARGIGVETH